MRHERRALVDGGSDAADVRKPRGSLRAVPDAPAELHGSIREYHVDIWGQHLFVRERGDGSPLLLINGLGGNVEMWGPAERRLSGNLRTIVFDAPGTGRSRTSPMVLPLPILARLIGRLLDQLGYDRVDVAGYSLGGVIAQQFAHTAPERVRRLALVATSCGWGSAPPEATPLALIATPLRYFSLQFYHATSHLLDGGERFRDAQLKHEQAEARNSYPPTFVGYAQQFLQGSTWSSLHWASSLPMPTLVIAGERDRLVPPANGDLLASRIRHSRLHRLPGEGHLMLFDPNSAALPLLEDYFGAADPEASQAWQTGAEVPDDLAVEAMLKSCSGAQPFKTLSRVYRGWVKSDIVRGVFGG